jgi:O-antigen/teichoic acid export membrane protein
VKGYGVLCFLAAAYAVELLQPLIYRLFTGIGKPGVVFKVSTVTSALTVFLSLIFVRPYGITGVAATFLLGRVANQLAFIYYIRMHLGLLATEDVIKSYVKAFLVASFFAMALATWSGVIGTDSYLRLGFVLLLGMPVHVFLAFGLALSGEEREGIKRWLGGRFSWFSAWGTKVL